MNPLYDHDIVKTTLQPLDKKYHFVGTPCKICGNTERMIYSSECRVCKKVARNKQPLAVRNANAAKRRAMLRHCKPSWYVHAEALPFFKLAQKMTDSDDDPHTYNVDHHFPICSDWVCGLHIPENFVIMEAKENSSKNNRRLVKYHGEI